MHYDIEIFLSLEILVVILSCLDMISKTIVFVIGISIISSIAFVKSEHEEGNIGHHRNGKSTYIV